MRTIIIGDVHGCLFELTELLTKIRITKQDQIYFLGDLLDKGPQGPDVITFLQCLIQDGYFIRSIMGNHEWKNIRYHANKGVGMTNVPEYLSENDALITQAQWDWISTFPVWTTTSSGCLLVHGGLPGDLGALPAQTDYKSKGSKLMYCRFLDPKTKKVSSLLQSFQIKSGRVIGTKDPNLIYWADDYDGRFGFVAFGHQPFFTDAPHVFPHAVALDLGCVYGNRLAALVISETGTKSYVTVKAKQQYAPLWDEE